MRSCVGLILGVITLCGCSDTLTVSQFKPTPAGKWKATDPLQFHFSELDSLTAYDVFITVRNDNTYPYSNLFLITELNYPDGQTTTDTLEYDMATPEGEWLGQGYGSVKENKLWYKENIFFPVKGVYTLEISHAMRQNGKADGIQELQGITDVGFEIEKHP